MPLSWYEYISRCPLERSHTTYVRCGTSRQSSGGEKVDTFTPPECSRNTLLREGMPVKIGATGIIC